MVPLEQKQAILAAYLRGETVKRMSPPHVVDVPGRVTKLSCRCGGSLREFRRLFVPPGPRPHRTKRIRKKWYKKWKQGPALLSSAVSALQKPHYHCEKCGSTEGFYQAIGRNMFPVEPMPPAAITFYTTEE
jgi:hypothetical protein